MKLDNKDLKIVERLKENSRESIRDIAKKINLRPSTVHQRISKLKEKNVIEKYTLKLNNKLFGENFIVFMFVKTKNDLGNAVLQKKCIKEIFGITGQYDLIIKLKFKDIDEFNNFIIVFRKNPDVVETMTMISTTTLKEEL